MRLATVNLAAGKPRPSLQCSFQRQQGHAATSLSSSLLSQQPQPPPPAAAAASSSNSRRFLPQQQQPPPPAARLPSRSSATTVGTAGSAAHNLPSPKATRPCGARTCIQTDSGGGRRSHDPPVLQVEREEAETRATKREHSITLAAPVGDEADSPDQVLASTLLGAKGGLSPSAAKRRGAMRLPASRARRRRSVVPSARPGPEACARGATTAAV
jgi:hypothetical protein